MSILYHYFLTQLVITPDTLLHKPFPEATLVYGVEFVDTFEYEVELIAGFV